MVKLFVLALILAGCRGQQVNWNDDPPWSAPPVTVQWSAIDRTFDGSFTTALAAWNYAVGCQVMVRAHDDATANVAVSAYDGFACGHSASLEATEGAAAGTWRCSTDRAEVKFRVMSDIRSVFVVAEHELGHVLGLAHDRSGLMNASPTLYHPEAFAGRVDLMPLPSDADGSAVGARYCR